jgi:hypothetical protein
VESIEAAESRPQDIASQHGLLDVLQRSADVVRDRLRALGAQVNEPAPAPAAESAPPGAAKGWKPLPNVTGSSGDGGGW